MKKILIAFLGLYFVLLTFNINLIPLFVGDEHVYSMSVQTIMSGAIDNNNHPLLAKEITTLGVVAISMFTSKYLPIFWRIGSIFASLGCLIIFYKICRLRFNEKLSFLAMILFASDPMFFSFSHILNLDIFSLVFSLISLYFLLLFTQKPKLKSIFLSAFIMGLSLSAKFNLAFILPLIPIVYFILTSKKLKSLILDAISYLLVFLGLVVGNIVFFFFHPKYNFFKYLSLLVSSNFDPHSVTTNYQTSPAWSWFTVPQILTLYRMIFQNTVNTIVAFQNPVLFILTIPTVCIIVYLLTKRKIKKPKFILVILIYLTGEYLPWLINIRPTYYYYIIPLIPLIIILVIQTISLLPKRLLNQVVISIAIISVTIFLLYYPILVGLKIPSAYENKLLLYKLYKYPPAETLFIQ